MPNSAQFPHDVVDAFNSAKIIGVRSGSDHKYTGVWVVVVNGKVYARSWNDKSTGWFRAFKQEPEGWVQVGSFELPVRVRFPRNAKVLGAVTNAYAQKYNTKASRKWVEGFAEPARQLTTLEFVPR
ncbi:MAG TPA: DUF2255 family protein [Thermoanaerobaculia bacterium]|jgi:hypothetical protein|nr:DUF2255 family protein [Thermoanaerobaculia bacterium]